MTEKEFCDNCTQKHNCGSIYRQMGNTQNPSIVSKIFIAFVLPLVVFIISLGIFEEIFGKKINSQNLQTILGLLLALLVTFFCILITRFINKRLGQAG
ncbi:MAG: SoxR reducing system RseC family protein [Sedimentisphaerales bacterium]|nr:SoxR reducing system RseC family protein [Sedimentisphaerales bacterium]